MGDNSLAGLMNSTAPGLASVLSPIMEGIGQQVGGAAGKEVGHVVGQGLQGAEGLFKQLLQAFGSQENSPGLTSVPSQCPKSPCPFSPGKFPPGMFDNPWGSLP